MVIQNISSILAINPAVVDKADVVLRDLLIMIISSG